MAAFPADAIALHVCVARADGITVFDACPVRATFAGFSSSAEIAGALQAAGLPQPRVEPLGDIHRALGEPSRI